MKKILAILIILVVLFLAGCISEVQELKTPEAPAETAEPELQEDIIGTVETPEETAKTEIQGNKLNIGESLNILGKKIKLLDVTIDGEAKIEVNGLQRTLRATRASEIINNIEVYTLETKFTPSEKYAVIVVNEFRLKENEYLLFLDSPEIVNDIKITLNEVEPDDNSITISTSEVPSVRIRESYSKVLGTLKITNIKAFPNPVRTDKYAIIKLEEI